MVFSNLNDSMDECTKSTASNLFLSRKDVWLVLTSRGSDLTLFLNLTLSALK